MERHIADNLTYRNVLNDLMTQRIYDYAKAAVEHKLSDAEGQALDNEQYERWLGQHLDDIMSGNAIPQILSKNIDNVVTSSQSSYFLKGVNRSRAGQYAELDSEELIGAIGPQNLRNIADPSVAYNGGGITKNDGQLNYQHTKWRVAQSNADMIAGIKNAQEKGEFAAWDTETVGGPDEYGKQRYDGVTEITIKRKKYNAEAETIESFGSAIGFSLEQKDFAEKVYRKIDAGAKLTGREAVWAHRLMLIGQSTAVQAQGKMEGVYEYSHFADKDEILDRNPEYVRQGIDKGFALGEAQRALGTNATFAGEKMYAWEADTLKGFQTIIDKDLTAVGHNTVNFDRKAAGWLLQHGMWSEGGRKVAAQIYERLTARNGDLHFDHEVDTEAVQNQFSETRLDNYITKDENGNDVVNEDALKYAKERNLTAGQQEAIGHALYPDMYDGADVNAHTSDVDVDVVGKMFTSDKYRLDSKDSFLNGADSAAPAAIKGDGNQLFHMTRSHTSADLAKNGLLGFVMDDLSEDAYTSFEGVAHSAKEARKLIYKPGALQKGVTYSITNVSELSVSKELQAHIARIQPDADTSNLIAVEWTPEYDESVPPGMRQNRKVITVGARFNQESLINESALMFGVKDENGEWQFTDNKEVQDQLKIRQLDENGQVVGARNATVADMLKESSENLRDGGALRATREHSLKKDMGLLQYADDMKAWGAVNGTENLENRFYEAVAAGQTDRSLADYFGYMKDGKQVVESPTISSAMSRLDYVQRNEQTIREAAELALGNAGNGQTIGDVLSSNISHGVDTNASYYYKAYMDSITEAAVHESRTATGLINDGAHAYELNKIEIDMNGFKGRYDYNEPFRLNLNAGGKTNFKNLALYLGKHTDMAEDQAVALLADFQKFLANSSTIEKFGKEAAEAIRNAQLGELRINGNNNVDFAFSKITRSLILAKKDNPSAGILTSTEKYNLLAHQTEFGLSAQRRKEVLDAAGKTIAQKIETSQMFGEKVTNELLFNGETNIEAVKKKFMEFGYSEHDATKAAYIREQQRRDTVEVMTNIAEQVRRQGGNMGMDAESKTVWVDANGKRTVLNRMLQNVVENGMSFIRAGNQSFHAPVGFYATNIYNVENGRADKLDYKFMSKIGAAHKSMGYIPSSLKRAADRGQLGEGVQDIISALANKVSQSAGISTQDFQEMRMGGNVDVGGILPLIAREDVWNELSSKIDFDDPYMGEGNRALRNAVESIQKSRRPTLPDSYKAFSTDVGITTAIRDIMPELHKYLDTDSQDIMRKILGDNYQDFSVYTKAAGKGMINVYDDMHQYGTNLVAGKRGAEEFTGRANKFYADGEALDGKLEGVKFGHAVNTAIGHAYEEDGGKNIGREVSDVVRGGRIRMATGTAKEIAANAKLSEQTRDLLFGAHLTEGASIVDPRYIDAFWSRSKAMQRVRDNKVLDFVEGELDHIEEKNKMAARVKINDDGTIGFRYSKGLYVNTEELGGTSPLTVKGMSEKGTPLEVKQEGVMRLGFFSNKNNLLASEKDIEAVLNRQENVAKISQAANKQKAAFDILKQEFSAFYYNRAVSANTNLKVEEYLEKGMHNGFFGFLGRGGSTAAEKAEDELMAKALGNIHAKELMDFIPHREMIEAFKSDNIADTMLGAYLEGKSHKKLTHEQILEKLAKDTGVDADKIGQKLFDIAVRERYRPWDEFMGAVGATGAYTADELRGVHSVSNFVSNGVTKHTDVARNIAVNLLAKGYTEEHVANELKSAIGDVKVTQGKNGAQLLIADPDNIDITKLQEIAKKHNLEDSRKFYTGQGQTISESAYRALSGEQKKLYKENEVSYSVAELSQGDDYDRARISDAMKGKTWKYDYRSQAMANIDRYSAQHLKDIESGLVEALGADEGARIFKKHFGSAKIGARTGEGFFQDLERSHWYTPGEKRVLIHGDLDENLLTNQERREIASAYASLEQEGISKEFTDAVVETAKRGYKNGGEYVAGSNADYVSVDKVKAHYSLNQHLLADQFNKGNMTMEEVTKAGFGKGQVITMKELFTPDNNFKDVEGHLYGKSAFLDLHIDELGEGNQIYKDESQRFIALPWTDQHITEESDDVIKNLYQKKVSSMLNTVHQIQSGQDENGKPLSEERIQDLKNNLAQHADDLRQAVLQNALDKEGIVHRQLGTSYLGMSAFHKAYGVELYGNETGFWGNISFDGENLSKLARTKQENRAVVDFQVASHEVRNRYFNDKYFSQLGFKDKELEAFKEDVFARLETSGTLSTNSRNPQGYDKSTSAAAMYFSKAVTGNELKVSAAMWESKKGDYDSDEAISHVLTGDVVLTRNGKKTVAKIDYATFEQLQEMAKTGAGGVTDVTASSHAERMWADAKSQIWGQAVTRNRLADRNVSTRGTDADTHVKKEYDYGYMDSQTLEGEGDFYKGSRHVIDGTKYHKLEAGQRTLMRSQYEALMEQAKGTVSADAFAKLDEAGQRNLYSGYVQKHLGMDSEQGQRAMDALGFIMTERREVQDAIALKRNAAAGQMNNAVFRLFQVADASGQFANDGTLRGIGAIHTALNEAFLSPKNEKGVTGVEDINRLTDAAKQVYGLITKAHPNKQALRDADQNLENIAYDVLANRDFKELKRYVPGFEDAIEGFGGDKKKIEAYARNLVHETFGSIGHKVNAAGFDMNVFDIGMKNGKTYSSSMNIAYGGMQNSSMNDIALQEAAAIGANFGNGASALKHNASFGGGAKDYQEVIRAGENYESNMEKYRKAYESATENNPLRDSSHAKPPTIGDLGRSASRALSNVKISGGAIAKVGGAVLAGLAASGIAGGVHTTSPASATTQAAGASEALQEQQVPQLSDGNINVLRGGPQSGYVINISASSPQGSDAARSAITEALGSSVPVNTSMNINMNTNYQDQVNQLQISRILENMI